MPDILCSYYSTVYGIINKRKKNSPCQPAQRLRTYVT